jgi:transposase-like protein
VSRAAALLYEELCAWRTRPLGEALYPALDARYENMRQDGSVLGCAILIAVSVREDGKRSVLAVSVSLSEAEVYWRNFLAGLQRRGPERPSSESCILLMHRSVISAFSKW